MWSRGYLSRLLHIQWFFDYYLQSYNNKYKAAFSVKILNTLLMADAFA